MVTIRQTLVTSLERLSTARPGWIVGVLALYVASLFIVGLRWRSFVRALGGDVGVLRATLATLGGISVANLTPSSRVAGEACRIALARMAGTVTWRQATVAAVWDRLSEVPAIVVVIVMAVLSIRHLSSNWRMAGIGGGVVVALVLAGLAQRSVRRSGGLLAAWKGRLAIDRVSLRVFMAAAGYSAAVYFQDFLRLTSATLAFGVTLSPTRLASLVVLMTIGGLVPTLGGLGAVEGGLVAGLTAFGVDLPTAAAITAAERVVSYGFSTSAGALVVVSLGGRSLWTASRARPSKDAESA